DLLTEGVFAPAGDGDVHIWPCLDASGRAVVIIELSSPHGEALLQAASRDVCDFLQTAFTLVPLGAEDLQVDVDRTVAALLASED
ncbi:MAG: SsgA family sporulation/cell division regulator, partial [Propionibacteriales bacterium]|nr:SsgA family sporulation/cell division regulator [Propionibacteriales bacterium]